MKNRYHNAKLESMASQRYKYVFNFTGFSCVVFKSFFVPNGMITVLIDLQQAFCSLYR